VPWHTWSDSQGRCRRYRGPAIARRTVSGPSGTFGPETRFVELITMRELRKYWCSLLELNQLLPASMEGSWWRPTDETAPPRSTRSGRRWAGAGADTGTARAAGGCRPRRAPRRLLANRPGLHPHALKAAARIVSRRGPIWSAARSAP